MEEAFGGWAPDVYELNNLNASQFKQVKAQMRITPQFKGLCAVVGSSSSLLKTAEGALIDSADTVVRVNALPKLPDLFAAYTGKRTDVLVSTFDLHIHTVDLNPFPAMVFYCHTRSFSRACWNGVSKDGMFRVCPRFVRRVRRSHGLLPWPSTGFIAFELANVLCDEVHVYGFGIDPLFSNCSHYYNAIKGDPSRCGIRGIGNRLGNSFAEHHNYLTSHWHDLEREVMLIRNHPFTLPPIARVHSPLEKLRRKRSLLRKHKAHNESLVLRRPA